MQKLQKLIIFKEVKCPLCKATDLYVLQDPEISRNFLITRVYSDCNKDTELWAIYENYSNKVGAEIYPTIMLGFAEDDYYPYIFHVLKQQRKKHVEISEEERKRLREIKDQILKFSKLLSSDPLRLPKDYNTWKKTYGG